MPHFNPCSTHRRAWALFCSVLLVVSHVGCSHEPPAQPAATGATSTSDEPEPRIVALLPFAADQLIAMGCDLAAVPLIRGGIPSAWEGLPSVAIDHASGPNIEQIIVAKPDVIIISSVYAQFVPQIRSETGAEVVIMDIESVDDIGRNILTLGQLCGREERAKEMRAEIETMDSEMDTEMDSDRATPGASLRTLAIFGTPHAFYAFLPDSYLGDLIEQGGGKLITEDMRSHPVFSGLAPISMEVIIDRDPQVLVVVFHGDETSARAMLERDPLWSEIDAVRHGRVHFLRDDLYAMRPGSEFGRAQQQIHTIMRSEHENTP